MAKIYFLAIQDADANILRIESEAYTSEESAAKRMNSVLKRLEGDEGIYPLYRDDFGFYALTGAELEDNVYLTIVSLPLNNK